MEEAYLLNKSNRENRCQVCLYSVENKCHPSYLPKIARFLEISSRRKLCRKLCNLTDTLTLIRHFYMSHLFLVSSFELFFGFFPLELLHSMFAKLHYLNSNI